MEDVWQDKWELDDGCVQPKLLVIDSTIIFIWMDIYMYTNKYCELYCKIRWQSNDKFSEVSTNWSW